MLSSSSHLVKLLDLYQGVFGSLDLFFFFPNLFAAPPVIQHDTTRLFRANLPIRAHLGVEKVQGFSFVGSPDTPRKYGSVSSRHLQNVLKDSPVLVEPQLGLFQVARTCVVLLRDASPQIASSPQDLATIEHRTCPVFQKRRKSD